MEANSAISTMLAVVSHSIARFRSAVERKAPFGRAVLVGEIVQGRVGAGWSRPGSDQPNEKAAILVFR